MIKRLLVGSGIAGAMAAAFLLGSLTLGIAGAQTSAPTTQPAQSAAPAAAGQDKNTNQDKEANKEEQVPAHAGSVKAPADQQGQSEQDEVKALAGLAKITSDQAKEAALGQFQGAAVKKVELENENGSVVYGVQLTDKSGKAQDVKVDAGNGKVLANEAEGPKGAEGHGHTGPGGKAED